MHAFRSSRVHRRALLLPVLVLLSVLVWQWLADWPIDQVQVHGQFRYLKPEQLSQRARQVIGQSGFFDVDIAALRAQLLQEPWLREVKVQRLWPGGIRLYASEQSAVARWAEAAVLNEKGQIFHPRDGVPRELMQLPHLQGPEQQRERVFSRFRLLEERARVGTGRHLVRLHLSARGAWTFSLSGGLQVKLGRSHFSERLQRALDLLGSAKAEWLLGVRIMDMRYPNGVALGYHPGV